MDKTTKNILIGAGALYLASKTGVLKSVGIGGFEDITFTRIKNDIYGNPRYVVHYLEIAKNYDKAVKIANKIGGRKFHNKQYGGGIVFQSYNTADLKKLIRKIREV